MTYIERFLKKLTIDPETKCWIWHGAKTGTHGQYGGFHYDGRMQQSHRAIWQMKIGPIPEGLTIDHVVCKNTLCQNVEHMELVTRGVNSLRGTGAAGENSRKTHCPRGHEYNEENTRITPQGFRACKQCEKIKQKSPRGKELAAARQARYRAKKM